MKYQSIYEDVQRLYKVTIHALVQYPNTLYNQHWYPPLELSLIHAHDNLYYYYIGANRYEILHYL